MKLSLNRVFLVGAGLGLLLLASCETKDRKKAAPPAPQAVAPTLPPAPARQEAAKPASKDAKPDPVSGAIAEAEADYQAGLAENKAGHPDNAKRNFDHAIGVLTQGPVSIKADDRLQQEFDKIAGELHRLEMASLKAGDGFTEQKTEPAPIDEANMVTPQPNPKVMAQAEVDLKNTQSDLPLVINDYVAGYINYYATRGKGTFERAWARSGRYREMISRVFREEGVPQDLVYLAQAESGFHPLALSRAGARGMWQFMASRATGYGLQRSLWVDDRQDPEKATRAAARHLKDLYAQFGDWYLAMAAYNSGPGNVQQAVKRTGYADFWELYKRNVLPKETKNYVPIILAMTIMSKNPAQYGLDDVRPDEPEKFDVAQVDYAVDLRLVAECIEEPVELLAEINPSLLRRTTPKGQPFDLRLPAGTLEKYQTTIAAIPANKRALWRYYKMQPGDTLAGVARKYKTTERAISLANNLEGSQFDTGAKLIIPASGQVPVEGKGLSYSRHPTRYKVRRGDTILSVADDFSVPPEKLRGWNRLKGNQLRAGRLLVIYKPLAPGQADHRAPAAVRKRKKTGAAVAPKAKSAKGKPQPAKDTVIAGSR
ncbi:MAG TPA: transglycosylase SLT domain-containing protein [Candidatus Saccharimonadales bacterium]|nr:transglycosylase SLT domain-containing protein [Candidatus Saccharimonadales bacterium]